MEDPQPLPQILSPCSSGRRRSSADSSSPEFEFWMVRNPASFPQPNLLSADELFSDGVLLPLHHLLHVSSELPPPQDSQAPVPDQVTELEPLSVELGDQSATSTALSTSKRWRYIFKKSDKKVLESSVSASADDHNTSKEKDIIRVKDKKRDQKKNGGGGAASNLVSAAELNINIWPFSRSRSAGNGGSRPRWAAATRKASSAPCSRSNSTGESKSRKWPNSPSRAGVHLGRSSPVWQVRRGNGGFGRSSETVARNSEKGARKEAGTEGRRKTPAASSGGGGPKARVLSLNVPMCIGYRHNMSCRNDENSTVGVAAAAGGGRGASGEGFL
ncbi:hypothetical protein Sango_2543100 [Sesamum angolense]|uniref:Uncharacterized protein n=1 Tax=Sesamum angolense TaxID=2727404 RepID=A0AAE1W4N1_9LAMI|nr:hypothetical protein Sango_2543100 [Sesamum angolense]